MACLPASAWAIPRYAAPAGSGVDCIQESPCDLATAVGGAADGDEVIVAQGDYGSPNAPIASEIAATGAVDVHGAAGAPRPRIFSVADSALVVGPAATLRDLEIQHSGAFNALRLGGVAERIVVRSHANPCALAGDRAALLNSACWAIQGAPAVSMEAGDVVQLPVWTATLRNVTAYSASGEGIGVTAGNFAELVIAATNVIAHGGARDVRAEVTGSSGTRSAKVALDHSNFARRQQIGGGSVTDPGTGANQTAIPLLVDDPLGDFHQLAGSPTINAGVTDPANGVLDFDGQPRMQGAGTDIGADEFPPVVPAPAPVAPRSRADRRKPVVSRLRVQPAAFAALRGRGASLSAKRAVRRGATVRYRVTERAALSFTIQRVVRGRLQGNRCLARRRTGKRCTRYIRLRGRFSHSGRAGANRFRFTGRLNRKGIRPGRYRLVGIPRDAAGNRGRAVRAHFRIVRG